MERKKPSRKAKPPTKRGDNLAEMDGIPREDSLGLDAAAHNEGEAL